MTQRIQKLTLAAPHAERLGLHAKLIYIGGRDIISYHALHELLKHINPVLYSHYRRTVKPTHWGGVAWVVFYDAAGTAVACYNVLLPSQDAPVYSQSQGGYEVGNEAVLKSYRGKKVSSQVLFPSLSSAISLIEAARAAESLPLRGNTVAIAVDTHQPSTAPTVDFLVKQCGFALVPRHWFATLYGEYIFGYGYNKKFLFADTEDEVRELASGVEIHATRSDEPSSEIVLYKQV